MSNRWIVRCVSVTAMMIGVCAVSTPAAATSTVPAGVIVYAHGQRLRTILPDGSDRSPVGGSYGRDPVWSPDGSKLAFDFGGIDTMRADGTHVRHLTSARDTEPSWSPDGRQLVFTRQIGPAGLTAIFRINSDGTGPTRLTRWAGLRVDPAWSPDGSTIAYADDKGISLMNPDGTDKRKLGRHLPGGFDPAWSPDGQKIAFVGGGGCYDTYSVDVDGHQLTRLTYDSCGRPGYHADSDPSWSLDGSQLVYCEYRRSRSALFRINADGSDRTRLTEWSERAVTPSWGPDARRQ